MEIESKFCHECYNYLKNRKADTTFIIQYIIENNIDYIESYKLKKGMRYFDLELVIDNLYDNYIYKNVEKKITYNITK
jgi:hypothetical protein